MAFIFVSRTEQLTYYVGNGQPGFGSLCLAGDAIHFNSNTPLTPAIPVNQNAYLFGSITVAQAVLPDDATMALVSSLYWDCEYNPGKFPAGDGPATAFAAGAALRTALNAYNTRVGRSVKFYAYFHTPVLDYDPGADPGGVARSVNGGTVGIAQWQQPAAPSFVTNGLSYVTLLKTKTIDNKGGIRLVIFYKVGGTGAVRLTSAQLLTQVQLALSPTGVGGLGADIWETYYGTPINPTTYYQPFYDVLNNLRNGVSLSKRSAAPARAAKPARSAAPARAAAPARRAV